MSANHGNTLAAWTAVVLASLAFVIGGIGVMVQNWTVFWVGVAFAPAAVIAGLILAKLGYHNEPRHQS